MKTLTQQQIFLHGRAFLCLLFSGLFSIGAQAQGVRNVAETELQQRLDQLGRARIIISEGDILFSKNEYASAASRYRDSYLSLPDAPMTAQVRQIALAKYAQASVEFAKELIDGASFDEAEAIVDSVLAPDFDPSFPPAIELKEKLQDDEYFERGSSPQHVANVKAVRKLLIEAKGFHDLGQSDMAALRYNEILSIDPFNKSARNGIEETLGVQSAYAKEAYNHTRSRMLSDVSAQWEGALPKSELDLGELPDGGTNAPGSPEIAAKLKSIIIPKVEFRGASLEEIVEYLIIVSRDLDTLESDPSKRGVNIVINDPNGSIQQSNLKINLKLDNVPLGEVIRYAAEQAGMRHRVDEFAVEMMPFSARDDFLVSRRFLVPPDFFSSSQAAEDNTDDDPFAETGDTNGGLAIRTVTPEKFFSQQGVGFPEGSSVIFNKSTGRLVVRNTPRNLELIEAMVDSAQNNTPALVRIQIINMMVSETRLQEIGFDWLLGQSNIPGSDRVFLSGGTPGNQGSEIADASSGNSFPFTPPGESAFPVGQFPITSGNRSGTTAFPPNTVDDLLEFGGSGQDLTLKAPGILGIAGAFTDPQFQVLLRGLRQSSGKDLIEAPAIVTRSGQRAKIESIREFIYPSEYSSPEIPQNFSSISDGNGSSSFPVTPSAPESFEVTPLGTTVEVEAVVGADNFTIDVNVAPDIIEFLGFINYGSPITSPAFNAFGQLDELVLTSNEILQPVFSRTRANTAVSVWDGATIAIAGFSGSTRKQVEDRTPFLGDLPGIGRLFRSDADKITKTSILIFVNVRLIDPSGEPINKDLAAALPNR